MLATMQLYTKLMRYLYTLLFYAASPFVLLRMLWRSRRVEGYRHRLCERFGYIKSLDSDTPSLWLHAVSVGEVIAAVPLIKALLNHYPHYSLMVTTTTPTGSSQVQKNFKDRVRHVYLPYDLPGPVKRFLKRVHPQLAILMETELWPNLLHYTNKRNIPVLLANARLSERSLQGYQKIAAVVRKMLTQISCVAVQSPADGERFVRLGLSKDRLLVTGNVKFDLHLPTSVIQEGKSLRKSWGERLTLMAASTHEGEEIIVLEAFRRLRTEFPDAFLILAPRHPDRFTKVARLCENAGFSIVRRSLQQSPTQKTDILLGDTMGELCRLYAASDVAFVGGSLVPVGGHNLIEPAAIRLPIISGPQLQNFVLISELLKRAQALLIVNDSESLCHVVSRLFKSPEERSALGERAYQVSAANTGAVNKHMRWISRQLISPNS
ncbi:3-deoxy-D-manno-octulosonic acid transferase [Coxiella burnetii]|nr:3-deoxy-D-manno-octulosonic acid transferase [Coxiella burnetii]